jgi:hypothetical protein
MRAVMIPPDSPPCEVELSDDQGASWAFVGELVGGPIEPLPLREWPGATMLGNEQAKVVNPPGAFNPLATSLVFGDAEEARAALDRFRYLQAEGFPIVVVETGDPREPYIAGTVVVLGFDARRGEHLSIPSDLAATLLGEKEDEP